MFAVGLAFGVTLSVGALFIIQVSYSHAVNCVAKSDQVSTQDTADQRKVISYAHIAKIV